MTRRYLAWDIEISKELPEGEADWQAHMPLGISCMATYAQGESGPKVWFGSGDTIPSAMSKDNLILFVDYLHMMISDGYTIVTWNGFGFDWPVLAHESGLHEECCELALEHVDCMFQVFCLKGFPLGLDSVSRGLGVGEKLEGMNGSQAPILWRQGECDKVLAYVAQDARMTLQVALEIEKRGSLSWVAKSGRLNHLQVPRLFTVFESLQLPEPDTAWMSQPIPRERFTAWMSTEPIPH